MNWELLIAILALGASMFGILFTIVRTRKSDKDAISEKYQKLLSRLFIYRNEAYDQMHRLEKMRDSNKKEVQNDPNFLLDINNTHKWFKDTWDDLDGKVKELLKNHDNIDMIVLDRYVTLMDVSEELIKKGIKKANGIEEIFKKKN